METWEEAKVILQINVKNDDDDDDFLKIYSFIVEKEIERGRV